MPAVVIDLSTLTPEQGFSIVGDGGIDLAGYSVSSAGDVNGDGFDDVIVGAPFGDEASIQRGEAYVIFGQAGGLPNIDLTTLTPAQGFMILGDADGDQAGRSVSSAGDINGDGFADLIVGAPYGDNGGRDAGEAYVVFGHAGEFGAVDGTGRSAISLTSLGSAGFVIRGDVANDHTGYSVASAGDVNGDGFDDLIVGAPRGDNGGRDAGEAYVIFGHGGGFANIDLTRLTPELGFIIQGDTQGDEAGLRVSPAGDVNGDGFADLMVGAPYGDDGGYKAGEVYVIFGHGGTFANIDLTGLAADQGFVIQGESAGDWTGYSVSSAGDINGDGFADLIVGAPLSNSGDRGGEAWVIFGHGGAFANVDLTALSPEEGFLIQGDAAQDRAGRSVSSAGDINGDGFADLIVGAPYGDDGGNMAGEAYVIFGHAGAFADIDLSALAHRQGFVIQGHADGDWAGRSVSSAGDVNDDGFADLIVGAPFSGNDAEGAAYVIFGQTPTEAVNRTGTEIANTILGGAFDDTLHGLGGNDTLEGGGGNDLLRGGAGIDTASYEHATAGVSARLDRALQDTGDAGADTFNSIEDLTGSAFIDVLIGSRAANTLTGLEGGDFLHGGESRDTLLGGDGGDMLDGGAHKDTLTGGAGHDRFRFDDGDLGTSRALADVVTDFSQAEGDLLRLNLVDADAGTAGDQAFAWLGDGDFTGAAGQLHYVHQSGNTFVEGDLDGDSVADVFINLTGTIILVAEDFVL